MKRANFQERAKNAVEEREHKRTGVDSADHEKGPVHRGLFEGGGVLPEGEHLQPATHVAHSPAGGLLRQGVGLDVGHIFGSLGGRKKDREVKRENNRKGD